MMRGSIFRKTLVLTIILFAFLLSACQTQDDAKVKAWIDAPKEGISFNINTPVNIMSHVYAKNGASEVILYADGEAYRRDAVPADNEVLTSITQEWIPAAPGEVLLQVVVLDKNGERSLPASVLVNVTDGKTVSATPVISPTPLEDITATLADGGSPTPVISITPTLDIPPTSTYTPHPPTRTVTVTTKPEDTQAPPAPVQTSPGNPETLSCRTSQTLVWQAVNDESSIAGYFVKLEVLTSEGTWQSVGGYGPMTSTQANVNVQCDNMYRWMVRAQDGAGNSSEWSLAHMFIIIADALY